MMEKAGLQGERSVLLVEDDGYCGYFLTEVLRLPGLRVTSAAKGSDILDAAADTALDAVIVHFQDRVEQTLVSMRRLAEHNAVTPIIAVSEEADVDVALAVVHAGAFDYLVRPFNNAARVEQALRGAFSRRDELRKQAEAGLGSGAGYGMIGKGRLLVELQRTIRQIGPMQVNVLICGESGTGKELIARAVHLESERRDGPFVAVNCGAVPEALFESIFFGHEKGAFTGATRRHAGFLEEAQGGTFFLDEVGELTAKGQVALLRFLENQEFTRVGGSAAQKADVRIIAATNRNLDQAVDERRFRADLYYRLNVVYLRAPSLRRRTEDILPLADYFLTRFCLKNRLDPIQLSPEAVRLLEAYDWPGNVRELENLMEGLAATLPEGQHLITRKQIFQYSGKILAALGREDSMSVVRSGDPADSRRSADPYQAGGADYASRPGGPGPFPIEDPSSGGPAKPGTIEPAPMIQSYREACEAFEARYFKALLEANGGSVAKAARQAGIHPVTLHRKLRKLR